MFYIFTFFTYFGSFALLEYVCFLTFKTSRFLKREISYFSLSKYFGYQISIEIWNFRNLQFCVHFMCAYECTASI